MKLRFAALSGASLCVLLMAPSGAAAAAQPAGPAAENATLGEIVVTARRRSESLQDVPQVVNAVTSDDLKKLNITQFKDIQRVVAGVNMKTRFNGQSSDIEIRGVSFESTTSAAATVAIYLNEAPIQPNFLFNAMFDIGQIEILRGPQGTQRGVPAPSGALTVTTRKPDLGEFGGYVDATVTDLQGRNINGAVNIPIIRDVLAVRIAGAVDENDGEGVRSLYSRVRPRIMNTAERLSVSFEPSDAFNANLVYTHIDRTVEQFIPVTGPGFAGLAPSATPGLPPLGLAPTPPIGETERVGVADATNDVHQHLDSVSLQLDSRLFGQHLAYIGAYQMQRYRGLEDRDVGQNLIGVPFIVPNTVALQQTSHEIRISSDPAPNRLFDYVVGGYYSWEHMRDGSGQTLPASFLPVAFGSPLAPSLAAYDPSYRIPLVVDTPLGYQNYAVFGSVTLHLGEKTELTAGARQLWVKTKSSILIRLENGTIASPVCAPPALLPGPRPGTCTLPTASVVARPPQSTFSDDHMIYNVTLSHRLTRDLMVYGNVGTAYRRPFASVGVVNATNNPVLAGLQVHPPEHSRAYEVGVKWTFLDGRGRLNAALFKQKFNHFPILTSAVPYIAASGVSAPAVQSIAFTANPSAEVDGFDIDAAFQITPRWSVSGQFSYADGRATLEIPCNDSNFDGAADGGQVTSVSQFPPGVFVALCPGGSISETPYWNASVQTEYVQGVNDEVDAYVRGLLTIYPKNARATEAFVVDSYTLLNLYAGLRAADGAWEAGLFVRNAFNTNKITDRDVNASNNFNSTLNASYRGLVHDSGYFAKTLTPRREVGINVRYAFGSR
jgi:iron complex outermembrane receptor protein